MLVQTWRVFETQGTCFTQTKVSRSRFHRNYQSVPKSLHR